MHITSEELTSALRGHGLRVTKARRAICAVIAEAHAEHLSAADILERVRATGEVAVDQSTVYRTLEVLQDLDYLRHVHFGHGPGVFHLTDEAPHHHLVCDQCGKSVDVPAERVRPVLKAVSEELGFESDTLHFALSGRCKDCG